METSRDLLCQYYYMKGYQWLENARGKPIHVVPHFCQITLLERSIDKKVIDLFIFLSN